MEQEAVYKGPGYRLVAVDRLIPPSWEDGEIRVSRLALRLDAEIGALGEAVAGLLLPHVEVEGPRWAWDILESYRRRVAAEQAADLTMRLGRIAGETGFRPSYLPVSRMHLFWRVNGCFYREGLDYEVLDAEWERYASLVGEPAGGGYRPSPRKYREILSYYASRIRGGLLGTLAGIARRLAPGQTWPGAKCDLGDPPDPGLLASLPEGVFTYKCSPEDLASPHAGRPVECGKAMPTASSLVCRGPRGRVVVKEYYRMLVKWLPAAAASRPQYRYRVTPRARMANEYQYLRLLRSVVETPRILAVCGDQAKAAMARTFLEGEPVLDSRDPGAWKASGDALARIHEAGYTLGDPNPGNFIVGPHGTGVVDAEQADRYTPRRAAWDLAVYTVYALAFRAPEDLVAEGLRGYAGRRDPSLELRFLERPSFWASLTPLGPVAVRARRLLLDTLTSTARGHGG